MTMAIQNRRHRWLRSLFLVMVGSFALVMSLSAAESPAEVERVGELGGKECLAFEGTQTFFGRAHPKPAGAAAGVL
ncbi:MAG: hypothetical protein NT154_09750 [Verrucomicrobia bacterium]|nr:hypothetical protein [Verrucomicrobiota bacterium]